MLNSATVLLVRVTAGLGLGARLQSMVQDGTRHGRYRWKDNKGGGGSRGTNGSSKSGLAAAEMIEICV